jgi:hypothetical protein
MPMTFMQYTIAYNYLSIDTAFMTDLYIALHVHGSVLQVCNAKYWYT